MTAAARYRFGDPGRVGVVLGMSLRQTLPIAIGVLWLTLWMVAGVPLAGILGKWPASWRRLDGMNLQLVPLVQPS